MQSNAGPIHPSPARSSDSPHKGYISDDSTAPSIGSVRKAKITQLPLSRMVTRTDASGMAGDRERAGPGSAEMDAWLLRSAESAQADGRGGSSSNTERKDRNAGILSERAGIAHTATLGASVHPFAAESAKGKGKGGDRSRRRSQSSAESAASFYEDDVDTAETDNTSLSVASDPRVRPEQDALSRMTSILGTNLKIISKAPWDSDEAIAPVPAASSAPITSPTQSIFGRASESMYRKMEDSSTSPSPKDDKARSQARSKSISVLTSRGPTGRTNKEREDALHGLGLGLALGATGVRDVPPLPAKSASRSRSKSAHKTPPTPPFVSAGLSFLDLSDSPSLPVSRSPSGGSQLRKSSSPAELGSSFSFPSLAEFPTPPPSVSKPHRSKSRSPAPLFDMISPVSTLPLPTSPSAPSSAPANMTRFPSTEAVPLRSLSGGTLSDRVSTSPSIYSLPSSTPTSSTFPLPPHSPTSLASPISSTTPNGPGYKLISLAEARQRELDRVEAAAALRKAQGPVEHPAGREDGGDRVRPRQSSFASTSRSASVLDASAGPGSGHSEAGAAPPRTLKSKKSGFLKRMMGGDKLSPTTLAAVPAPELPVVESFRALPDDYHPGTTATTPPAIVTTSTLSVTVSSPPASVSTSAVSEPRSLPQVAFLHTPPPDPSLRLRKGLAPSLSLRPISMAFSAGLPTDFLADEGDTTPRVGGSPSDSPAPSPLAPSFRSGTTGTTAESSPSATPVTPGPLSPLSPHYRAMSPTTAMAMASLSGQASSPADYAALQEQFARAKKGWQGQQWDLETQIRVLKAEVLQLRKERSGGVDAGGDDDRTRSFFEGMCDQCGRGSPLERPVSSAVSSAVSSVVDRPRGLKGNGSGTGTLFGSGAA